MAIFELPGLALCIGSGVWGLGWCFWILGAGIELEARRKLLFSTLHWALACEQKKRQTLFNTVEIRLLVFGLQGPCLGCLGSGLGD